VLAEDSYPMREGIIAALGFLGGGVGNVPFLGAQLSVLFVAIAMLRSRAVDSSRL